MRYLQDVWEKARLECPLVSMFVSTSPLDTIPGRQCMASCFFLLRQFEDVLIYLNSIKVRVVALPGGCAGLFVAFLWAATGSSSQAAFLLCAELLLQR